MGREASPRSHHILACCISETLGAICYLDRQHESCEGVYRQGAAGLGIPRNPDYNGASQPAAGYLQRCIRGLRPAVVSGAVRRSISASSSAPTRMTIVDSHSQIIRPLAAPSEPYVRL